MGSPSNSLCGSNWRRGRCLDGSLRSHQPRLPRLGAALEVCMAQEQKPGLQVKIPTVSRRGPKETRRPCLDRTCPLTVGLERKLRSTPAAGTLQQLIITFRAFERQNQKHHQVHFLCPLQKPSFTEDSELPSPPEARF